MIHLERCTNCEQKGFIELFPVTVASKQSLIVKCKTCSFVFLNPQLEADELSGLYQQDYFKDYTSPDNLKRLELAGSHLYSQLKPFIANKGNILDIGAASGSYLYAFKSKGWCPYGIEFSEFARKTAMSNYNILLNNDFDEADFKPDIFDLIIMIQSIEHMTDPSAVLRRAIGLLKPNGILFISTPNFGSVEAKKQKALWPSLHPGEHLFFFTTGTLVATLKNLGLSVVSCQTPRVIITSDQLPENILGKNRAAVRSLINKYFSSVKNSLRNIVGKLYQGDCIEIIARKDIS